jgi:hypothetical protein
MSPFEKPQGRPFEPLERPQGPEAKNMPNEKPPVFNRWSGWYWLVFLVMVAQVLLYLYITRSFS